MGVSGRRNKERAASTRKINAARIKRAPHYNNNDNEMPDALRDRSIPLGRPADCRKRVRLPVYQRESAAGPAAAAAAGRQSDEARQILFAAVPVALSVQLEMLLPLQRQVGAFLFFTSFFPFLFSIVAQRDVKFLRPKIRRHCRCAATSAQLMALERFV